VSGVCLKYETNRAVEVGRLVSGFHDLGQYMQNIPRTVKTDPPGEPMVLDEPKVAEETGTAKVDGQGAGKKKKKTKR
jgi:Signal recognition particle 9 kDa protein (SRP9)